MIHQYLLLVCGIGSQKYYTPTIAGNVFLFLEEIDITKMDF